MIQRTEAYITEDGILHMDLPSAVSHDLNLTLTAVVLDPNSVMQDTHRPTIQLVADAMATDAKLRSDVLALLRALLGSLS